MTTTPLQIAEAVYQLGENDLQLLQPEHLDYFASAARVIITLCQREAAHRERMGITGRSGTPLAADGRPLTVDIRPLSEGIQESLDQFVKFNEKIEEFLSTSDNPRHTGALVGIDMTNAFFDPTVSDHDLHRDLLKMISYLCSMETEPKEYKSLFAAVREAIGPTENL